MDIRVKQANEMLRELEDKPTPPGILENLIGGFIVILIGTSILSSVKNGCKN